VLDIRLNNRSQLAGFSKATDLEYFLRAIAGIEYRHLPGLAPVMRTTPLALRITSQTNHAIPSVTNDLLLTPTDPRLGLP
jgi:hypothetical protein